MAIPGFQTIMLPLLRFASDGRERTGAEAIEALATHFNLSEADREELLPSGKQKRFSNRVSWARGYLGAALLLESVRRGVFRITPRGLEVLRLNPSAINIGFLEQFPEFRTFREGGREEGQGRAETDANRLELTPEEALEANHRTLQDALVRDLLDRVRECTPGFFERIVLDLLVKMGYGGSGSDVAQAVGRAGDEGIDGVIKEDKLGLDIIYVQAKRWQDTVGRPVVQAFAGALDGKRARKGILITTSQFSNEARGFVQGIDKKIVLIDGDTLARLMIEHDIGVLRKATYDVKAVQSDYFVEE